MGFTRITEESVVPTAVQALNCGYLALSFLFFLDCDVRHFGLMTLLAKEHSHCFYSGVFLDEYGDYYQLTHLHLHRLTVTISGFLQTYQRNDCFRKQNYYLHDYSFRRL
jgi:hypothetical protein